MVLTNGIIVVPARHSAALVKLDGEKEVGNGLDFLLPDENVISRTA